MDTKSKILAVFLGIFISLSIGYLFWKTLVRGDYVVNTEIPVKE